MKEIITASRIEQGIFLARGQRVMQDADLAELYGIPTKVLIQALKRNLDRFPSDFMFQLNAGEYAALRSQFVTSKRGGCRYLPFVFTEQGVAMLSSILRSKRSKKVAGYLFPNGFGRVEDE